MGTATLGREPGQAKLGAVEQQGVLSELLLPKRFNVCLHLPHIKEEKAWGWTLAWSFQKRGDAGDAGGARHGDKRTSA